MIASGWAAGLIAAHQPNYSSCPRGSWHFSGSPSLEVIYGTSRRVNLQVGYMHLSPVNSAVGVPAAWGAWAQQGLKLQGAELPSQGAELPSWGSQGSRGRGCLRLPLRTRMLRVKRLRTCLPVSPGLSGKDPGKEGDRKR